MKRCSIIIHSISGNCYIIGSYLKEALGKRNVDVRFYRVEDSDLHIAANESESANEYYEEILSLPEVTLEKLQKSDMIILGSPTRFGNVSAEMKVFLDKTFELSERGALEDKFFACFTSCPHSLCEGARALDTMHYWAQNQRLIAIPFGVHMEMPNCNQPVQGLVHLEGKEALVRPSTQLGLDIEAYADILASFIQE
ncbi:MAG: flavodoxin family protein [Sphaerochaetaceae bacterium]|nr:flavodoxin family protein [Sphaerochaetaceae bacterium]